VQEYLSRKHFAGQWERQVRSFLERLASPEFVSPDTPVCLVTRTHCEDFCHAQGGKHHPHTAFRVLRGFFNELLDDDKLQRSPCPRKLGKQLRPAKVVQEYFHEHLGEFAEFYSKLPDDTYRLSTFKQAFYLALATGLRLEDVCLIQESEIDSEHDILIIEQGKTGSIVRPYLSPQVADAILLQRRNKARHEDPRVRESQWLFCKPDGEPFAARTLTGVFMEARRTIFPNRPKLHFHCLRHSFGQNAYNYTGQHDAISVAMGHGSPAVTLSNYATNARYVVTPERYATLREYLWSRPVLSRLSSSPDLLTGKITETECITQPALTTSNSD